MKKCRFCDTPMLPLEDIQPESDVSINHCMWECHNCPSTVKSYSNDEDWFSILTFYKGHWYEVMQFYTEQDSKEPPLLTIYKLTVYQTDTHNTSILSEFITEFNVNGNITPQNIKEKLATLLVFS